MEKHTILRRCGCTEDVDVRGAYKAQREAERLCLACYRQAKAIEVAASAEADGLPALKGSPEQVAWAMSIRHEILAGWESFEERLGGSAVAVAAQAAHKRIRRRTDASWWIKRRGAPLRLLFLGDEKFDAAVRQAAAKAELAASEATDPA